MKSWVRWSFLVFSAMMSMVHGDSEPETPNCDKYARDGDLVRM